LIDMMLWFAVILTICILGTGVEGFLTHQFSISPQGWASQQTFTSRWYDVVRWWCLRGLWYVGIELDRESVWAPYFVALQRTGGEL
jgi:hypothetical protein